MLKYPDYLRGKLGLVAPSAKFETIGGDEAQEKLEKIYLQLSLRAYLAARELDKLPARKPAEPANYADLRTYQEAKGYSRSEAAHMAFVAMQRR